MRQALIVFIKKPTEGKVKTRLAHTIGHFEAVRIYEKLLRKTEQIIKPLNQDVFIYSDDYFDGFFEGYTWRLQKGEDLGVKMHHAFEEIFDEGYQKISIIGSDCFELTTAILQDSFQRKSDTVIGKSTDGGYYLLGLTQNNSAFFSEIEWSTDKVFEQTYKQIESVSMNYSLLPTLTDIDTVEDLRLFPKLNE